MDLTKDDRLNALLSDNKSGSIDILIQLNRWLKLNITKQSKPELLIQKIKSSLSHFQTINTYLDNLNILLQKNSKKDLFGFFENQELELNSVHNQIFENGWNYVKNAERVITISNSYSVARFLIKLHEQKRLKEIVVCESRPVLEGRLLAEKLLGNDICVRLITEAAISKYLGNLDAAIIGADKILSDGSIVNKIGSRQLSILCRYASIPLFVVADKSKFTDSEYFEQAKRPENEIWDYNHKNLKIENLYFERIEKELITRVLSN